MRSSSLTISVVVELETTDLLSFLLVVKTVLDTSPVAASSNSLVETAMDLISIRRMLAKLGCKSRNEYEVSTSTAPLALGS